MRFGSVVALVVIAVAAFSPIPRPAWSHPLISEVVVTPTDGEFIEIVNPEPVAVVLDDYFLTDLVVDNGNQYTRVVFGPDSLDTSPADFLVRFPDSTVLGPGENLVIASNADRFVGRHGFPPDFELHDTMPEVPDMIDLGGTVGGYPALLRNDGEIVILFYWDGISDLVSDVDLVRWGDRSYAVDKTGLSIDGPDPDSLPSTYVPDTPIDAQTVVSAVPHAISRSFQRVDCEESGEVPEGGNGLDGHDETSEDLRHWTRDLLASPGVHECAPPCDLVVQLTGTPDRVVRGGLLQFRAEARNPCAEPRGFDRAWLEATGPASLVSTLYEGPTISVAPATTIGRDLSIGVPPTAPAGTYLVTVSVSRGGALIDADSFTVLVE